MCGMCGMCTCVRAGVCTCVSRVDTFARARSLARSLAWVSIGHCSVASSYATLHIQLTYKYNDVTIRTTLLPRVSIQRDATRRSRGVFSLELFRDLDAFLFLFFFFSFRVGFGLRR